MKSRKAVSSRKQEDSNDNLKSYFSEDKDSVWNSSASLSVHREIFPHFIIYILLQVSSSQGSCSFSRTIAGVFWKSNQERRSGYAKYITGKKEIRKTPSKGAGALSWERSFSLSQWSTKHSEKNRKSLSDCGKRGLYAGLYGRWRRPYRLCKLWSYSQRMTVHKKKRFPG